MNLNSAQEIIDDIKAGKMVILMDDEVVGVVVSEYKSFYKKTELLVA